MKPQDILTLILIFESIYVESTSDQQPKSCTEDYHCKGNEYGEICHINYEGCEIGICACPSGFTRNRKWKCVTEKRAGESCDVQETNDKCGVPLRCLDGKCKCARGTLTDDGLFCKTEWQRVLGEHCVPWNNSCFRNNGFYYDKSYIDCNTKTRRCECGLTKYKKQKHYRRKQTAQGNCIPFGPNEKGCGSSEDCAEGATCDNSSGICLCPFSYKAWNGRCVREGAIYGRKLGESCLENDDSATSYSPRMYCNKGLICKNCGGTNQTCTKYRPANVYLYNSNSTPTKNVFQIGALVAATTFLFR